MLRGTIDSMRLGAVLIIGCRNEGRADAREVKGDTSPPLGADLPFTFADKAGSWRQHLQAYEP